MGEGAAGAAAGAAQPLAQQVRVLGRILKGAGALGRWAGLTLL